MLFRGGGKMSEIHWFMGKYKVEVIKKGEKTWLVKALERIPLSLADGMKHPVSIAGLIGIPLAITPEDEFETAPENLSETASKESKEIKA